VARRDRRGDENLCEAPGFTGWDSDGGYAGACAVDERYAYRLPESLAEEQVAPLLCARIWLSDIPRLDDAAELFQKRRLRSVTANARRDGEELLQLAERLRVSATTVAYPMAEAPTALADLAHRQFGGAAVLVSRPAVPSGVALR